MTELPASCPFCLAVSLGRVIESNAMALALRDDFPVTEGHTLVVPRRHVCDYFELTPSEREGIHTLLVSQKEALLSDDNQVEGFNIGWNCGLAAGQTVFHAHVHLIPRRKGDTRDPRGGIRHVIPGRGFYKAP